MLANAYGMVFLMTGVLAGVVSIVVAILVEVPLLAWLWRRRLGEVIGWVILANIISAAVGAFPVFCAGYAQAPGPTADPWYVYQHEWLRHLLHASILFAVTLVAEGATYFVLNRRSTQRMTAKTLCRGLVVANLASYLVLVGYVVTRNGGTGDFVLRPDTAWLSPCPERVWYVDPASKFLWSVRLDGLDKRQELPEPPPRRDAVWERRSDYAIAHDEGQWKVISGCVDKPQGEMYSSNEPYFARPFGMHDERAPYRASTAMFWLDGSGSGLQLESPAGALTFGIPAGVANLACRDPAILPTRDLVVFRCGGWIMVMDIAARRVGRLVRGDSMVVAAPAFRLSDLTTTNISH